MSDSSGYVNYTSRSTNIPEICVSKFVTHWTPKFIQNGVMLCVEHISSFGAPNWVIPVGKEPLSLYLQMSNMEIGIQEVFCVECVVCVTLIRGVKC